jgi:uncharacterized protein (DUF885 family)
LTAAALTPDELLSYDLWIYQLEKMQASEPFFYDGLIFDQMNGIQSFVPTFLINFHRVDTQQDMEAYIQRVEAVAPRMQEAIEIASKGLAKGRDFPHVCPRRRNKTNQQGNLWATL